VIVRIEAPGMHREDFNVELHDDVLKVRGQKKFDPEASPGRCSVVQCAYGSFRRDVALPVPVKSDRTKASYRDGVLRIELSKADAARARRIAVKTPSGALNVSRLGREVVLVTKNSAQFAISVEILGVPAATRVATSTFRAKVACPSMSLGLV
jgi:hypothetical protein